MKRSILLGGIGAVLLLTGIAGSQENNQTTPAAVETPGRLGIAAKYPGDVGIENDPAVVLIENFERSSVSTLNGRWTYTINPDYKVLRMVEDSTALTSGTRCLEMKGTRGHDTGGELWKLLDSGYEKLHARVYVKFAEDAPYVHHFLSMGGRADTIHKYPIGGAGSRPNGTDRFGSSLDLHRSNSYDRNDFIYPPGSWAFYSYWPEMHSWQTKEGVSDGRPNPYYGNVFGPIEPEQAMRGQWQCVEFMIKLNDPELRNGEQAFWIDGKLIERYGPGTIKGTWANDSFRRAGSQYIDPQPFEGFRWRTTEDLKINIFRLQYYLAHVFENDLSPADTTIPYNGEVARVYFDNIVLATEYIGPVAAEVEKPHGGDYDGDGQSGVMDVIRLLKICGSEVPDPRADYNSDGYCNVRDALSLLLDIIAGKT